MPDNSFDAVVLMEVIEHLEEPLKAISEIYRILKLKGLLVIGFLNDLIFFVARSLLLKFKELFFDPGHVKQWSPREMKEGLENCGFACIQTKNIPFRYWQISLHSIMLAQKVSNL